MLVVIAVAWMLALVFAHALFHKLREPTRFRASMAAYALLPAVLVAPVAGVVMVLEAAAVFALLLGSNFGVLLAALLLAGYAVAIAINVVRGRTHLDCGCGDEPVPVSWAVVARNVLLVVVAIWAAAIGPQTVSATGPWGLIFSAASAAVGFGIFLIVEQLLANRGRYQRLWLGEGL
jgi:hypothetical protein